LLNRPAEDVAPHRRRQGRDDPAPLLLDTDLARRQVKDHPFRQAVFELRHRQLKDLAVVFVRCFT